MKRKFKITKYKNSCCHLDNNKICQNIYVAFFQSKCTFKNDKPCKTLMVFKQDPKYEANMICWHCTNANLERAKKFYRSENPNRPICELLCTKGGDGDIPDPFDPVNEGECHFEELGHDIRGDKH